MGDSIGGSLISDEKLRQMYAHMLHCRLLTEFSQEMPSARLYKDSMGQEAIACGCTIDLRPEDTIVVAPHDSIARLIKGAPLNELVRELHERPSRHNVEMKLSMAMDAAVRHKKKKSGNVVLLFAGKSTAKRESWQQTMEMAGKAKLPMIFVAPKANDHGTYAFPVFMVDANDVVAMYRVVYESLERVREHAFPVLIQTEPYRLSQERDPLLHLERYLKAKKLFSARWKKQVAQQFSRELGSYLRASRPSAND